MSNHIYLIIFLKVLFLIRCVCVWLCVSVQEHRQEEGVRFLELELQVVLSCLMCVLGTELRYFMRIEYILLTAEPALKP